MWSEKMWRWEDEIQTPTIGRTLRSDALGNKPMQVVKLLQAWPMACLPFQLAMLEFHKWMKPPVLNSSWNPLLWEIQVQHCPTILKQPCPIPSCTPPCLDSCRPKSKGQRASSHDQRNDADRTFFQTFSKAVAQVRTTIGRTGANKTASCLDAVPGMFLLLQPILIVSSLVWWRTASCLIALQVQFLRLWRSARSPFKQVELRHNQNSIKIYQNKLLRFSVLVALRAPLSPKCMLGSVGPWGIHANMQFYRKAFDTKNAHTLTDTPARDTIHHLIAHDHTRTLEPSSHTSFQHKSICPLVWKQETLVSSLEGIAWKYELLFQILIFILQVSLQLPSRLFKNLFLLTCKKPVSIGGGWTWPCKRQELVWDDPIHITILNLRIAIYWELQSDFASQAPA